MKEPEINVGIVNALEIAFTLNAKFLAKGETVSGKQRVSFDEGGISWNGNVYRELTFTPLEDDASFSLEDVTIGINFHWERQETQTFLGTLRLVVDEGKITAINQVPAEDYLTSVISSRIFQAAHAISRSGTSTGEKRRPSAGEGGNCAASRPGAEYHPLKFADHTKTMPSSIMRRRPLPTTRHYALQPGNDEAAERLRRYMHKHAICDARFSKCCGGVTEEFNYCWEDKHYPYLSAVRDLDTDALSSTSGRGRSRTMDTPASGVFLPHHRSENPFTDTQQLRPGDTRFLLSVTVRDTEAELAELIATHTKSDYGEILDLIPVERGKSGRISRLKIVGTLKTMTIGKELEIRRTLSPTHLFSSAFVVDKGPEVNGVPEWFELTGAGWGHGVGLCQIGAAVMGEKGYSYDQILLHYYQGAEIVVILNERHCAHLLPCAWVIFALLSLPKDFPT